MKRSKQSKSFLSSAKDLIRRRRQKNVLDYFTDCLVFLNCLSCIFTVLNVICLLVGGIESVRICGATSVGEWKRILGFINGVDKVI